MFFLLVKLTFNKFLPGLLRWLVSWACINSNWPLTMENEASELKQTTILKEEIFVDQKKKEEIYNNKKRGDLLLTKEKEEICNKKMGNMLERVF